MKYDVDNIPDYLGAIPEERKQPLQTIIALIKKSAPKIEEAFDHGMPFYNYKGYLFAVASQKHFMALYVSDHEIVAKYKSELGKVSLGKSCIRFKKLENLNMDIVELVIKEAYKNKDKSNT